MTDLMRMSVTSLDAWRYFLGSETMTEDDFIADLKGQRPSTPAMRRGTAFHMVMEVLHAYAHDGITDSTDAPHRNVKILDDVAAVFLPEETFNFRFDTEVEVRLPAGHREHKVEYALDDIGVNLVGKADVIGDLAVYDYKTQDKALDVERYFDAMQWRAYLLIFGRDRFVYEWYRLKPTRRGDRHDFTVIDSESFDQWRYLDLPREVINVAADLADFRRSRGLEVLPRKGDDQS